MQDAKTDRLGLVAFAGDAFLECPLTIDNTAFQQSVQALDVNSIPQGGTAMAAAINTALTAFKEKDHYKALVLLTDGEDNDNETGALEAAQNAAKAGLKIFTIGIGTAAGDLIRVTDANGNSDYVRDDAGQRGEVALERAVAATNRHDDRRILSAVARRGHDGHALRARPGAAAEIGGQRKIGPALSRAISVAAGGGDFAAAGGNVFAGAEESPKPTVQQSKVETSVTAAMFSCVFVAAGCREGLAGNGVARLQSGNYTNALAEFERLAEIQTNDLRLVFNAGAAAYRATNYDAALQNFQRVTLSPDLKLQQQAFYNLGNTHLPDGRIEIHAGLRTV